MDPQNTTGAKQHRSYLQAKFEDRKRPTGQDFADFIASYPNYLDANIATDEGRLGINLEEAKENNNPTTRTDERQTLPDYRLQVKLDTKISENSIEQVQLGNLTVYDGDGSANIGHNALINPGSGTQEDAFAIRQDEDGKLHFQSQYVDDSGSQADSMFFTIPDTTGNSIPKIAIGEKVNVLAPLTLSGGVDGGLTILSGGNLTVEDNLTVDGKASIENLIAKNLEVSATTKLNGGITGGLEILAGGDLKVADNVVVDGKGTFDELEVTKKSKLTGGVDGGLDILMGGDLNVADNLIVSGKTTLGEIEVNTGVTGGLDILTGANLNVADNVSISGSAKIDVGIDNGLVIKTGGNLSVEDELQVNGASTLGNQYAYDTTNALNIGHKDIIAPGGATPNPDGFAIRQDRRGRLRFKAQYLDSGGTSPSQIDSMFFSIPDDAGVNQAKISIGEQITAHTNIEISDGNNSHTIGISGGGDFLLRANSGKLIKLEDNFLAEANGKINGKISVGKASNLDNLTATSTVTEVGEFLGRVVIGNSKSAFNFGSKTAPDHVEVLQVNGDAAKTTGGNWSVMSDARVKKDVTTFEDGLSLLRQINPVSFQYNGKAQTPESAPGIGVIAQDLQKIFPYMIQPLTRKLNPGDKKETKVLGVNGSAFTYVLINAIKELAEKIEKLESQL